MYKKKLRVVPFLLVLLLLMSQVAVFAESSNDFTVNILGGEKEVQLSLEDLKSMPEEAQIDEDYIYNSKSGEKSAAVKGVSLAYVLKEIANIKAEAAEVIFEASDGYPIDPQSLEDIFNEDLKYVLAYEVDGEPVISKDSGNEEITIYRKVKQDGEFGTVYKFVNKITLGETKDPVEEAPVEEEPTEKIVFTDITEEYGFAKVAIEELAAKGIINGMGDGKYAPEGVFTRAQFAKIMVEALGYEQLEYTGKFTDVKSDDWFAPYVESAIENGLFKGRSEDTFDPNSEITRQEMATTVGRGAILAEVVEEARMAKFTMDKSDFKDKDLVADWAAKEVAWLEAQKVFADIATENFEPTKVINRAEAALVVYKALFSK